MKALQPAFDNKGQAPGAMPALPGRRTLVAAAVLFLLAAAYYALAAYMLPRWGAPDYVAHDDVSGFIHEHGRLPVLPRDEGELYFTPYGGTRALRPPLTYLTSAVIARILPGDPDSQPGLYRGASVLFCALTVPVVFLALHLVLGGLGVPIAGAVLLGLLPQFVFTAAYNNDDSGAIFSASLLALALVVLYRRGLSTGAAVLLGIAGGLVIVSKPTAWLLLPAVALALVAFARGPWRRVLARLALAAVVAVPAGAWWLGFNMYHYGVGDPLLAGITAEVAERHTRFEPDMEFGYQAQGIGMADLVFRNYDNFLGRTYKSTIGNLDWLRLRVGWPTYVLYLSVFALAMAYLLGRTACMLARLTGSMARCAASPRRFALEMVMAVALGSQFLGFLWMNVHNDIQVQGRYLLPVVLPLLLLAGGAVSAIGFVLAPAWRRFEPVEVDGRSAAGLGVAALVGLAALVHLDALRNHVIPFYYPPTAEFAASTFDRVSLPDLVRETSGIDSMRTTAEGLELRFSPPDPHILLYPEVCDSISRNALLLIRMSAESSDTLHIYIDRGDGFTERDSYGVRYDRHTSDVIMGMDTTGCRQIRIDPGTGEGRLLIREWLHTSLRPFRVRD